MTKAETRIALSTDLESFFAEGGTIQVLKSRKTPRNRQARGKQKIAFDWAAPVNRPCANWDIIETA